MSLYPSRVSAPRQSNSGKIFCCCSLKTGWRILATGLLLGLAGCATPGPAPVQPAPPQATQEKNAPPPPEAAPAPAPVVKAAPKPKPVKKPAPPPETKPVVTGNSGRSVGRKVAAELARQLHVTRSELKVSKVIKTTWPDGCFGLAADGEICPQSATPGYAVSIDGPEGQYEFRTDESGNRIRLASAPLFDPGRAQLSWKDTRQSFGTIIIGTAGVGVGLRGRAMLGTPPLTGERLSELNDLLKRYRPFEAFTEAGQLVFHGTGTVIPSRVQKRAVAEWAAQIYLGAESGNAHAGSSLVLAWHRRGGIAGFCDDVAVDIGGFAVATTCRENSSVPERRVWLNEDQLEKLFLWVDSLKSFELRHRDPAQADGMTISIDFKGNGTRQVSALSEQAMMRLGSELYSEASAEP